MGNEKKENIFKRIVDKIKKIWDRLGQADVEDLIGVDYLDKDTANEVSEIEAVQAEVNKQRSFVPRERVDESEAQKAAQTRGRGKQPKIMGDA